MHARADGLVWAADRGLGEGLRDVRLYGLSAAEPPDLLAMLYRVESGSDIPPEASGPASPGPARLAAAPPAAAEETGTDEANSTDDQTTPIRPPVAADRTTSAATEPPAPATYSPTPTPPVRPFAESGDDDGRAGFDRIDEAVASPAPPGAAFPAEAAWPVRSAVVTVPASAPPKGRTESVEQADPPTPDRAADEAVDSVGEDAADAEPHPQAGAAGDALGDDEGTVTTGPLSAPCPITLRILGRPTLLVDRPRSPAGDREASAGSVAGVDLVDPPDAVEVTATLSGRMRDLLVYLAVHPDGVRRDTAVAELWPDTGRQRPGNNLSSLISRLRAALRSALDDAAPRSSGDGGSGPGRADRVGPIVLVEGDRYRLDPDRIAVDYWTFLTDTATTPAPPAAPDAAAATDPAVLARLARAHGLYRGPLAEGIDHAWIPSVREATRRTFLALTARLVRHHVATDPAAALAILETTRNLEPTNQSIYRDIMALQLRLGDTEAAAATLRLLENQLADVEESFDDATLALARAVNE